MHSSKKLIRTTLALLLTLPLWGAALAAHPLGHLPLPPITTQDDPMKGGG